MADDVRIAGGRTETNMEMEQSCALHCCSIQPLISNKRMGQGGGLLA